MTHYEAATLEEIWSRDRLVERRLSHGSAEAGALGIVARDACNPRLVDACEQAMNAARASCGAPNRRIVVEATAERISTIVVVRESSLSVVTDPKHFAHDHELLRAIASVPVERDAVDAAQYPIVWRNGSAAVLLHEAVGHPLEQGLDAAPLPEWLSVDVDLAERRASFRDVPLRRMESLVARQTNAPFALPEVRIEVLLVDGGSFDPLTDEVSVQIAAADLVEHATVTRLPPFALVRPRRGVVDAISGASGEPVRYPGVICSREGQELFVASFAPLILTVFR